MKPRIELPNKQTFTRKEVEELADAMAEAYAMVFRNEFMLFKFAKFISYISLIISLLLIAKEVFM